MHVVLVVIIALARIMSTFMVSRGWFRCNRCNLRCTDIVYVLAADERVLAELKSATPSAIDVEIRSFGYVPITNHAMPDNPALRAILI